MAINPVMSKEAALYLLSGTVDPSVVPTDAPQGMLFIRVGALGGTLYQKQDEGETNNWVLVGDEGGGGGSQWTTDGSTIYYGTNTFSGVSGFGSPPQLEMAPLADTFAKNFITRQWDNNPASDGRAGFDVWTNPGTFLNYMGVETTTAGGIVGAAANCWVFATILATPILLSTNNQNTGLFLDGTTGYVGIGTNSPGAFRLSVAGTSYMANGLDVGNLRSATLISADKTIFLGTTGTTGRDHGYIQENITAANTSALFVGYRARGTPGAPTAIQSGDAIAAFGGFGYDGTDYAPVAGDALIQVISTQIFTPTAHGCRIQFATTPNNTVTRTIQWIIDQDGSFYPNTTNAKVIGTATNFPSFIRAPVFSAVDPVNLIVRGGMRSNSGALTTPSGILYGVALSMITPPTGANPEFGRLVMFTLDNTVADLSDAGDIVIETGSKTAGTGLGGNLRTILGRDDSNSVRGYWQLTAEALELYNSVNALGQPIHFYGDANNNRVSIRAGTLGSGSYDLIWPENAGVIGSIISNNGTGQLFFANELRDTSDILSENWTTRILYDSSFASSTDIKSLDWDARQLFLRSGAVANKVADWQIQILYDDSSGPAINWTQRKLLDQGNQIATNWQNRTLVNTAGVDALDWNTTGQIKFLNNVITNPAGGSGTIPLTSTNFNVVDARVTTDSQVIVTLTQNDATALIMNVVPLAGSFDINLAAPGTTANTDFKYTIMEDPS